MNLPLRILPLTALAVCPVARAQCPPSLSFFAGAPNALSVADIPGVPFDCAEVYLHDAGFHAVPPTAASAAPGGVHFDLRAVMVACGAANPPDIDALSLGIDFLPVDDVTGAIAVPQNQWALLSFSVTRTSIGRPGSAIHTESGRPDGPGADVFSFVLPGSALPTELVSRTTRAQDSREIDLGTGVRREVDALDQFIPLFGLEPALVAQLPARPRALFSVSAATLGQVPAMWWGGSTPSAATILQVIWSPPTPGGPPGGSWSCPRVFKRFDELGLTAAEDLDALAVDLVNQRVVFSTKSPARDELLFVYCGTDGAVAPKTLTDAMTNEKIEDKADLIQGDDVDGVCGIDPSVRTTPGGSTNVLHFYAGTPMPTLLPPAGSLQASSFKILTPGGPAIRSMLVGWPPITGVGPGWAACFFSPPNALAGWVPLLGEMRNLMPVHCGDPRVMTLPVPAALTLTNFEFDLRWFLIDAAATEIQDAHPLRIRL